jgi:hypothetical protein
MSVWWSSWWYVVAAFGVFVVMTVVWARAIFGRQEKEAASQDLTAATLARVPADQEWHMVHFTYEGEQSVGYVDGERVAWSQQGEEERTIQMKVKRVEQLGA